MRIKRIIQGAGRFLVLMFGLGILGTFLIAFGCWTFLYGFPGSAPVRSQQIFQDGTQWAVDTQRGPGAVRLTLRMEAPSPWTPLQATGQPDVSGAVDDPKAWASKMQDAGELEWLELRYAIAMDPVAIHVYESYNPGALVKVTAFTSDGVERIIWEGTDPTPQGSGRGVSKIPVKTMFPFDRIRLYLDSGSVSGWNEIDAVALLDVPGRRY